MRFVIVGNGKMAIDVLATLRATPGADVVMCIGDPRHEAKQSRLANECAVAQIPYLATSNINDGEIITAMQVVSPDYLVSANNFQIFRSVSLSVPRFGVLNFHNGPLPRYGGLNACSWALFNGESEHGVTWHLVDGSIDSGPILKQTRFPIDPDETAIGLVSRCIREGGNLLKPLAVELVAGTAQSVQQEKKDRLYFGSKERPWSGNLPWWLEATQVKRVARALSFHPMPNMFYRPRLAVDKTQPLFAEEVEVVEGNPQVEPGTVLEIEGEEVSIALPDALVRVGGLHDDLGKRVDKRAISAVFGIRPGGHLVSFDK